MIGTRVLERRGNTAGRRELGLIAPRAALGATMLYHGLGKLKASGREEAAQAFENLGIRPGRVWSRATGIAESAAGVLSLVGVLTRPAALVVLVTQAVAVAKVHARNGFQAQKGGYEFNLALMAIAAGLLIAGPGRLSTHEAIEHGMAPGIRRSRGFLGRLVRLLK